MFQLLWSVGALLPCEDYLHITISFSLKIDSELGLLCWFEKPAVIEAITTGFKTKTDSEGPCRHLLVKNIKKTLSAWSLPSQPFVKNIKKFGPPEIRARVMGSRVRGLNR